MHEIPASYHLNSARDMVARPFRVGGFRRGAICGILGVATELARSLQGGLANDWLVARAGQLECKAARVVRRMGPECAMGLLN